MTPSTSYILLLLCLTVGGQASLGVLPDLLLDWMSDFNGGFSNAAQIEAGSTEHDSIQVRLMPFLLFPTKLALLFEVEVNGKIAFLLIAVPDINLLSRQIITLNMYNFTDMTNYKFGQIKIEDLLRVRQSDLIGDPECAMTFTPLGDLSYAGTLPDCRTTVNGKHPFYSMMFSCSVYTATVPLFVPERATAVPYKFQLTKPKFPILGVPLGYKSHCEKRKQEMAPCLIRLPPIGIL